MRVLFIFFAVSLILAWYAYAIRPMKRKLSNILLMVSGGLLLLLVAGFLRWV